MSARDMPFGCDAKSLAQIFDHIDLDHDGIITREEIRVCLALAGTPISDYVLDVMVALGNPLGDGKIRRADFIDFNQNPRRSLDKFRAMSDSLPRVADPNAAVEDSLNSLAMIDPEELNKLPPATRRARMIQVVHALVGVTEIRPKDIKILYRRFQELDSKKAGKLNLLYFSKLFDTPACQVSSRRLKNNLITTLFTFCDRDKSNTVDTREFITTLSYMGNFGDVEKLRFSFMLFDSDGDGFMDRTELIHLVSAIHVGSNKQELDSLISRIDVILRENSKDPSKYMQAHLTFDKMIKISDENPGLFNVFDDNNSSYIMTT